MFPPRRIVCLTEETVETLYLLGEQDRIVGISGYVVRPPEARRDKPRVSAFTSANIDKVLALAPDLVLAFSDLQAPIVAELIGRGVAVHAFNQRTVAGILDMIRMVGALVDVRERAELLAEKLEAGLAAARERARRLPRRPAVFFEEWDDPLIAGIGWVSELIDIAGGVDVFAERARQGAARLRGAPGGAARRAARDQIVADPAARSGRVDRRARRARSHHRWVGCRAAGRRLTPHAAMRSRAIGSSASAG
jgi:iron complex transport system substrate-binding protein